MCSSIARGGNSYCHTLTHGNASHSLGRILRRHLWLPSAITLPGYAALQRPFAPCRRLGDGRRIEIRRRLSTVSEGIPHKDDGRTLMHNLLFALAFLAIVLCPAAYAAMHVPKDQHLR